MKITMYIVQTKLYRRKISKHYEKLEEKKCQLIVYFFSILLTKGSFSSQNNISGGEIVDNHSLSQHLVHHKLPESVTSISSASSSSSASVAKPGGVGGSTSLSFPSQDHQSPSRHHYVKQRAVHASISSSSSLSESSVTNISNYSSGKLISKHNRCRFV